MAFVRISNSAAAHISVYRKKDGFNPVAMFVDQTDFDKWAQEHVEIIENDACVEYLEGLILHCKKAINRHARLCMEAGDSFEGPEWWLKYQEDGV